MKSAWISLAIVAGAGVLWLCLRPAPPQPPASADASNETSGALAPASAITSTRSTRSSPAQPVTAMRSNPAVEVPDNFAIAAVTSVRADRVLATVNGTVIGLKDLVPIEVHEEERRMTAEELQSRLERAIEMELTRQAAAARGVSLTPEQLARVEALGQKREETRQQYLQQGMTWNSGTPTQLEFEKQVTRSLLLQENMVRKEHGVGPSPDPAQQARYEQRRRELLAGFRARGGVVIANSQ